MFDRIVLRRSENGPTLSAGELAEALLFYRNVHLILDHASLSSLAKQIGMPTILALLARPNITAVYCESTLGVRTNTTRYNQQEHDLVEFKLAGSDTYGKINSRQQLLEFLLIEKLNYDKKQAKKLSERFRYKVPFKDLISDHYIKGGILEATKQDICDKNHLQKSVRNILNFSIGNEHTPANFDFSVSIAGDKFYIDTDLDFSYINSILKNKGYSEITSASLINYLLESRSDLILASHYGGDFLTSEINSILIQQKNHELLNRTKIDKGELSEFQNIVIGSCPRISDVINKKEKSFDQFLILLDKSDKFRDWTQNINPDDKLVTAYWRDVTSEGWINSLPTKTIRYVIGSVLGAVVPLTGQLFSFADTFLIEKMIKGWRPNHFIDRKLKPFLSPNEPF